jgi:microcystin-dependent protein
MLGGLGLGGSAHQEWDQLYVGEYRWMFDVAPPSGWLLCDGSTFDATVYPALAALLGDTFGVHVGDDYVLPDPLGRSLVAAGAGGGLTARVPGDSGGVESVALTLAEIPAHDHGLPSNVYWNSGNTSSNLSQATPLQYGGQASTYSQGSSGAHENMHPWLCAGSLFIYAGQ